MKRWVGILLSVFLLCGCPLMILRAKELRSEDTGTGHGTENTQIEDKHQLIDDGNATHLQRANLANHNVIQEGNKIGDAVLNDDGKCYRQNPAVEGFVADISLYHRDRSFTKFFCHFSRICSERQEKSPAKGGGSVQHLLIRRI